MDERGEEEDRGCGDLSDSNHQTHHRRTADVSSSSSSFDDLALPSWLVGGLEDCGFIEPSPVQVKETREEKERERKKEEEKEECVVVVLAAQSLDLFNLDKKKLISLPTTGPRHPARALRRGPARARAVRHGQDGRVRRACRDDRDGKC